MHIVVFSHGFGVYADDRGLFPDIISHLPNVRPLMFDYNRSDAVTNTLFATPLDEQVAKLKSVYAEARANNPDAVIDLVCHSQGCVVAAMALLEGIRKTIFLAPPDDNFGRNIDEKLEDMLVRKMRPGTVKLDDGSISYPRRDGSTTIIPAAYWESRRDVAPVSLYQTLAEQTELIIIKAANDEVIGETDFSALPSSVKVLTQQTGHDFEGTARNEVAELIKQELSLPSVA